jgi:alpha-tubulin suppressor-like RCC1 family protein
MALTSNGEVIAWGSNLEGQLGLSGISGLMNKPTRVPIPEPVKEISAGYYHSAFLTGNDHRDVLGLQINFLLSRWRPFFFENHFRLEHLSILS